MNWVRKIMRKPIIFEALRYFGDKQEIINFCGDKALFPEKSDRILIQTSDGNKLLDKFDWVTKDMFGELDVLRHEILISTYEFVE